MNNLFMCLVFLLRFDVRSNRVYQLKSRWAMATLQQPPTPPPRFRRPCQKSFHLSYQLTTSSIPIQSPAACITSTNLASLGSNLSLGGTLWNKNPAGSKPVQVNLCQKLLFLHQLIHNITTDCSLNYKINTWKFQAQNMGDHTVYTNSVLFSFWHLEQFMYTT